jgi:membrane associated rhomboid family serine protease
MRTVRNCEDGFDASVFWRLLSYQFTHGSFQHVFVNCFLLVCLGVPLEGFHGTGLVALMWTIGSVGGGCMWALFDPYTRGYGASGGSYALLGMHAADLVLNWKHKSFRFLIILSLLALGSIEVVTEIMERGMNMKAQAAHVGGGGFGLMFGLCCARLVAQKRRRCTIVTKRVVAPVLLASTLCFFLAMWLTNPFPAVRNLSHPDVRPWCWIGQVCTNDDNTGCDLSKGWQCVACDNRKCVEEWYEHESAFCVTSGSQNVCENKFADIARNV